MKFTIKPAAAAGYALVAVALVSMACMQAHTIAKSVSTGAMLLLIYGSPGDRKACSCYLKTPELAGFASPVAVNRPGFGAPDGRRVVTDPRQESALMSALIPVD